jgi:hypothetical protein
VGIKLYSSHWDDQMEAANLATGPRPWGSFEEDFLDSDPRSIGRVKQWLGREPDSWDDFLYWVELVQNTLESVHREADVGMEGNVWAPEAMDAFMGAFESSTEGCMA